MLRIVWNHFTDQKGLLEIVFLEGFSMEFSNEEDTGLEPCACKFNVQIKVSNSVGSSPVSS
ncbi:MAG: hypothetical protein ABIQ31_25575, partial [Ferruginibacter sp.]